MPSDPDALRLMAIADSIAAAIPRGEAAIAEVIAHGDAALLVASARTREGRGGEIWGVIVTLSAASRVTIGAWSRTASARAGTLLLPPPPQLTSPSNVPPEAWDNLPVYFRFAQPWGRISCECAHGDRDQRIRSFIVEPTAADTGLQ